MPTSNSHLPSRKWLATQITALSALLIAYVTAGAWNQTLSITSIGLGSQALVGYLLPNATDTSTSSSAQATPTSPSPSAQTTGTSTSSARSA